MTSRVTSIHDMPAPFGGGLSFVSGGNGGAFEIVDADLIADDAVRRLVENARKWQVLHMRTVADFNKDTQTSQLVELTDEVASALRTALDLEKDEEKMQAFLEEHKAQVEELLQAEPPTEPPAEPTVEQERLVAVVRNLHDERFYRDWKMGEATVRVVHTIEFAPPDA